MLPRGSIAASRTTGLRGSHITSVIADAKEMVWKRSNNEAAMVEDGTTQNTASAARGFSPSVRMRLLAGLIWVTVGPLRGGGIGERTDAGCHPL